ncbi:MAG: cation-translocating P-type ATPase [Clostridiales bacterium]|nr:cation-translocating P-type ATPase [Clostridiales bacterium]
MDTYNKSKDALLQELNSSVQGISVSEATNRQVKYGLNELLDTKKKSTFMLFLEQFKDFLVIILIIAAIVSMFLGDIESALVILIVITINAILGTVQNLKAEQSLQSLKALSSPIAKVLRSNTKITIPSNEVTMGDIVFLEAGDYIAADGRILENFSLKVNESMLTGESLNVDKEDSTIINEVPIGDRKNMVFSGSFVTYGRATILVTGIGMNTEIGKVAQLLKNTQAKKTPLQVNLDNFGKKLSIVIIGLCAVLFALSLYRGDNAGDAFMFAVALAVAAIPEALSSIVTIVLSFGTQKMATENAIIRKLHAVEGLGSVSIICSDKTGTLTQNKMTVKKYCVNNTIIEGKDVDLTNKLQDKLLKMSVLCNDSTNENGSEIGDPTEVALINFSDKFGKDELEIRAKYTRLQEIPFDSDRKLMTTVNSINGKQIMITKGAVDVLFNNLINIEKEDGIHQISESDAIELESINQEFSKSGLRVLAFAYKELNAGDQPTEDDLTFIGLIAMMDPPREESKAAVLECKQAGIRPVMITGDHKVTAAAIAKEIGILNDISEAIDGSQIDAMSDEELQEYVPQISVYARVSPEHKIRIVNAWQKRGNIVAMTGDGVNDAPALKQADVGVAMGITGSEVAKDAASMVLTDDNFATIVKAVENGRNLYLNIKNSIKFLLSGNTAAIIVVLYASLLALPVPFAAVHLLFINLLTDSLPAIALGLEPHSKSVMKAKPRPLNESILTKDFMFEILLEGLTIAIVTAFAFHIGDPNTTPELASTMAFATLCMSRLVHGFNCKSKKPVLLTKKMFNNLYLWGAFLLGFIFLNAVLIIPGLHGIFEVSKLNTNLLLTIYGLSLVPLLVIQTAKYILHFFKKD